MSATQDEHVGLAYEELTGLVDEFLTELDTFLEEDDELDVETVLRFVAALIYENNVSLYRDLKEYQTIDDND